MTIGAEQPALPDWFVVRAARSPLDREAAAALLVDGEDPATAARALAGDVDVYALFDPADGPGARPVAAAVADARGHGQVEVPRISVAPAHRGLGVDGRLLVAVVDTLRAAGARRVSVTVDPGDEPFWAVLEDAGVAPARRPVDPGDRSEVHLDLQL